MGSRFKFEISSKMMIAVLFLFKISSAVIIILFRRTGCVCWPTLLREHVKPFSKNHILGLVQPLGALLKTSFQQSHFELRSVAAHRNKSLICVPMDSPGITLAKKIDKMGMRVRHHHHRYHHLHQGQHRHCHRQQSGLCIISQIYLADFGSHLHFFSDVFPTSFLL